MILLLIYGLTRLFSRRPESSFKAELIKVDTAAISSIVIDPKGKEDEEITLKREPGGWIVTNGRLSLRAVPEAVNPLLNSLALIRTKRIAAKDPEKWPEFEVEEGDGTRVKVYQGETKTEDFLIGRFSFNPQAQSGVSYIRLNGQNEVYAVDGFQTLTFGQGFNAYRNRGFLKLTPDMKIREFDFHQTGNTYTFKEDGGQWLLNGKTKPDSAAVANFLNALGNVPGDDFADDFDELRTGELEKQSLTLRGEGIDPPIVISSYRDTTRGKPFVLHSSQHPETFFASDSSGLFKRLFEPVLELTMKASDDLQ